MNRLLIGILDIVNKLLALFIIVSATIEGYLGDFGGYVVATGVPQRALWTVIGFIIGLALAGIFSGFIAAVITIARELIALREMLAVRVWTPPPPA
jgi:hypothetical protein